jgi:hypothetical protein
MKRALFVAMVFTLCLAGCSDGGKAKLEVEAAKAAQVKAEGELAKVKAEAELAKAHTQTATTPEPKPTEPNPSPEPPKDDPRLQAFREKVAHYLEEARIGAKLLTLAPSLADAREKARHITDLYTRLPDIPPEVDPTGKVAERRFRIRLVTPSNAICFGFVAMLLKMH